MVVKDSISLSGSNARTSKYRFWFIDFFLDSLLLPKVGVISASVIISFDLGGRVEISRYLVRRSYWGETPHGRLQGILLKHYSSKE